MKKPIFFFLIWLLCLNSFSQSLYNDVFSLKKYISEGKFDPAKASVDAYIPILKNYNFDQSLNSYSSLIKLTRRGSVNNNPFLYSLLDTTNTDPSNSADIKSRTQNILNSIQSFDVTTQVNGVASFMINRAKQELTITFFSRFKKFSEDNPEFRVLFPKTTDNLINLLEFAYPEMLPTLQVGFVEDLDKLIYNFDDVFLLDKYRPLMEQFPEIRLIVGMLRELQRLESGLSGAHELITRLATLPEWTDAHATLGMKNIGNTLKLANIISESFRNDPSVSRDNERAWITTQEAKILINDPITLKIFMGLLLQKITSENIQWENKNGINIVLADSIRKYSTSLLRYENVIYDFIDQASKVDQIRKEILALKSSNTPITNDQYYTYISTSLDVIEFALGVPTNFGLVLDPNSYISIARKTNDLYKHIYKKQYPQAVVNALDIYESISFLVEQEIEKKKNTAAKGAETKKLDNEGKNIKSLSSFSQKARKYLLFISNVASAKDESGVVDALENAALPVGSSSLKKSNSWNISVQSYLGAFGRVGSKNSNVPLSWNDQFGVHAPIGISFSYGLKKGGSLSLFASILDIGAIVDYKLKRDSTITSSGLKQEEISKDYKIELGQIFSPGIFLVYGFPCYLPISLGFGPQFGPGLGKIDANNNLLQREPAWRWNAFLSVDIPFFTLYSERRNHTKRSSYY